MVSTVNPPNRYKQNDAPFPRFAWNVCSEIFHVLLCYDFIV